MIFLLDTDTLIFVVRALRSAGPGDERGRHRAVVARRIVAKCQKRQAAGDVVGVSAITVGELEFGARKSGNYDREITAVRKVLSPFVAFDLDASRSAAMYGEVRHALETQGVPIGAMDMLIAGHAMALGARLVTNNTAHFSRVSGLVCENWTA